MGSPKYLALSLALIAATIFDSPFASSAITAGGTVAAPMVDLGYAKYQGFAIRDAVNNSTNTAYLGIRYAAPPTGPLRFKAPHPPAQTPGVQISNQQPFRCFAATQGNQATTPFRQSSTIKQNDFPTVNARSTDNPPGFSEDCLFLNVWVPGALGQTRNLPVLVWIHGGGYVMGSMSGFLGYGPFDGNDLLRESGGRVVVVMMQYRLGLFGFLPGRQVKADGALNAGLLDQQFALRWVQENIDKFGGDPKKVTIWGESAGAGAVLQQVIANGGNTSPPLFRAAITSSTFLPSQYCFNDTIPETLYNETISQTNCSSAKNTLDCLRRVDIDVLQAANAKISNSSFYGTFAFVPVVDGSFITQRPTALLQQGKVNGDRLLSFTNTNEGVPFVDESHAQTLQVPNDLMQLFPGFGAQEVSKATALYAGMGANDVQATAIFGESILKCPTYFLLRAFNGWAFKGDFSIPPSDHGDDVPYYFPSLNANGTPPFGIQPFGNANFSKAFAGSFLDFVISLNPNVKWEPTITPQWTPWNGQTEMLFNKTADGLPDIRVITTSEALLKRCEFWESVAAKTAQ